MSTIFRRVLQFWLIWLILGLSSKASTDELKDVRPPIDYPSNPLILYLILGLILLLAIVFVYYLIKRYSKSIPLPVLQMPWDEALEKLEWLRQKDYPSREEYKNYYSILSDILRQYLEKRFRIQALEMTTEEFLESLKDSKDLTQEQKDLLKEFLFYCDMVKFAKASSNLEYAKKSFMIIQKIVNETKPVVMEKPIKG